MTNQYRGRDHASTSQAGRDSGELLYSEVHASKHDRDDVAEVYRSRGLRVAKGERVIRFDNVSITTYVLTARIKADPK